MAIIRPKGVGEKERKQLSARELRTWGADKLAKYKLPREVRLVKAIEKNQMGKINKKDLL